MLIKYGEELIRGIVSVQLTQRVLDGALQLVRY
jgi:hypothetical protein